MAFFGVGSKVRRWVTELTFSYLSHNIANLSSNVKSQSTVSRSVWVLYDVNKCESGDYLECCECEIFTHSRVNQQISDSIRVIMFERRIIEKC